VGARLDVVRAAAPLTTSLTAGQPALADGQSGADRRPVLAAGQCLSGRAQ